MNAFNFGSFLASAWASGCSGEMPMKLAPKIVSGRVVNTSTSGKPSGSLLALPPFGPLERELLAPPPSGLLEREFSPDSRKRINRPWLLPIQLRCMRRTFSGHLSSVSRPASNSSPYWVILKNHCDSSFCSTMAFERQPRPSMTCSLASTVWSTGSQFTLLILR